jgi:phage-related protein
MFWITDDNTIDFAEYGYITKTVNYKQIPSKKFKREDVIGRQGNIKFSDTFNNKQITVLLTAVDNNNISNRRLNAREINAELIKDGKLIIDIENDIYYNANVLSGSSVEFSNAYDELTITFDCDAIAIGRIAGKITWDDLDIRWLLLNISWNSFEWGYVSTGPENIIVENCGNIESSPLMKVVTNGPITIGNTIISEAGTYNIDTKNQIVYDDSLVNQISKVSGFNTLAVGNNTIALSGSYTSASINFEGKDWVI